ncbi:MAG: amino acid permease [Kiritimatiellae bacterium]|nr:amino acid permease [Kiritimatiellia bacterium]
MGTKNDAAKGGYGFGAFQGVFTPSILTIIGVVMYLRFGWMLGNVGLATSLLIVTMGSSITLLTGLSISALATNMRVKGGGAYFILSRSLGLEAGAALGIPLALSQTVCVSFYVAGFAEAFVNSGIPSLSSFDPRIVGLATLAVLALVSSLSADIALKSQYFIMLAIGASLVSFFLGKAPSDLLVPEASSVPPVLDFWTVFAVFFPAVTGILSGLGMSGDLKDPGRAIPKGTIAAVLVGYAIYMAVPIALRFMVADDALLRTDTMILQKCARWQTPILLGVWAATLSSAIGSFLVAPRVLQALSRDRLLPGFFAHGFGRADDPRLAAAVCFSVAALGIWLGDINAIAPVLTLFNLST